MRSYTTILLLVLFANSVSQAAPIIDLQIENVLREEKYLTALQLLQADFKKLSSKHTDTLSYFLYQTAECFFRIRNLPNLEKIIATTEKNTDFLNPYYVAKINVIKANYEKEKGDLEKTELFLNTAINDCKYPDVQIDFTLSLASLSLMKNNEERAEKLYRKVYSNLKTDSTKLASACNGIGACFAYNSKYDSAKYYYTKALQIYEKKLGIWNTRTAQVRFNLALIKNKFGDYSSSEKIILEVLKIYRSTLGEQHIRTAEAYGELGSIYMLEDNLEKALYYTIKERDILSALYNNKHPGIAYSYLNTGKIYFFQNDLTNAEQQFKKGIDLLSELHETNGNIYTQLIIELSRVLNSKKESAASILLLDKLLATKNIENEFKADIYLQEGEDYLSQKEINKAQKYFIQADTIYEKIYGDKNIYSTDALIALSNCYLQKEDFINANEYAHFALEKTIQNNKIIFPYDNWECRLQTIICKKELLKHHLISRTDIKLEIENIKGALTRANHIKQTYYSAGSQLHYTEKMVELNELGIYFLTHFYKKTDVYFLNNLLFFTENNKANLLRNKITQNASNEILPEEEQIKSNAITNKLNYFTTLNENQETVAYTINDSVLFYENQYETFTKSIEKKYPKIYNLKYGEEPLTISKIQSKLADNYTFLEYCTDNESYYCLAISKNNIVYKVCGNKNKIDSLITLNQTSIIHKNFNSNISHQLYNYLIPTSIQQNLIISPDAMIHNIAFDVLTSGQNTLDYFIYHHTIQYAFSANTYFHHQPLLDSKNIIGFYPDFTNSPFAVLNNEKEHNVLKLFSNYSVYHKQNASKYNFITKCNLAAIVHIASHLITDTISPLKSFLVFQPDKDYKLSINEIWKMNVNCQLITLASCQSNFGKEQNGEGVRNFAWAFHYAGARNILSTQWDASDKSTSAIISNFYKNLKNGKNKQEALQLAKINYLANTDDIGAQPFFWSNFYLYGDEIPVSIAPNFLMKFWWSPLLFFLLCYIVIIAYNKYYRKKRYEHL